MANTYNEDNSNGLSVPSRFVPQLTTRPPLIPSAFAGMGLRLAEQAFLGKRQEWTLNGYVGPTAAAAGSATNGIPFTDSGSGTGTITFGVDGTIVLTSGTTDEDFSQIQDLTKPFAYSATLKLWMAMRAKVAVTNKTDILFGLAPSDTSLIATSAVANTAGLYFFKADTATDFTAHVRASSTSTTQATGITIADATYFAIGMVVESGVIRIYAQSDPNDTVRTTGFSTAPIKVANTNAPSSSTALYPSLLVGQEGGTTARVLTVDWAFITEQRA